ncbi:hypothetical protein H632_c522p1 [Helicosporidium sp. ATCC 50920]|nr:hypothetical protein H632_c522p1 [Helicosporidium sp. ATCC 50920]|eukprot:KDD75740.1 hypothetical protein H632_c522p1 [Helicosporidium sp. ATCC 50920]
MSSGVSHAEEVKEMNKWRIVTFLAVPACVVKAFVDLSHSHHHSAEKPAFPYLNSTLLRSKDFPWGKNSLLE